MPIVVTPLGAVQDKSVGAVNLPVGVLAAGGVLVICLAHDDVSGVTPYWLYDGTNSQSDWSDNVSVTNTSHCRLHIVSLVNIIAGTVASFIRIGAYSAGEAVAFSAYYITGLSAIPFDKSSTGNNSGITASTGATAVLTQADEVAIAATAVEDEVDDAHGSWTTGAGDVSGNEQFAATNGGSDSSNIQCHSVARIVSATAALQGVDGAHDSTSWVAAIATYKGLYVAPRFAYQKILAH